MQKDTRVIPLASLLRTRPSAVASIRGSGAYPSILGTVGFYGTPQGVIR